jgi:uncharacterized protein
MRLPMCSIGGNSYVDYDRAVDVIRHAFEKGVNYIDSGFMYCSAESEIAVGKALKGWREKITVTTKATKQRMSDPGDLRRMLDHQLGKMDLGYFDFYCFHGVGFDNFHELDKKTGWISDMEKARAEGLIKHVAFSFHDKQENMKKLIDLGMFEMVTCQYNYLDRSNEAGIAYAHEKGLAVVVMGPVGGGRLSVVPKFVSEKSSLDTSSAAGLAVRYVLSNPNVDMALSGMGSVEMVDDNVAAVEKGQLSEAESGQLNTLMIENRKLAELYCTGCEYCMPCPHHVNIPGRFEAMNFDRVYGMADNARNMYVKLRTKEEGQFGPVTCQECGECEDKCPQNIEIIKQLKETDAVLAG